MARLALLLLILAIAPAAAQEAKPVKDLPDPRYPRLDRILARFADLEREHPELVRRESIGSTHRGEEIEAVVLGRRLPEDEPDHRPVVLLHGAQHANEPAGTAALMVLIERLLASPQRSALLEDLVVWVIPVVNPDGHRRVFSGAPGWREWRKNGREPHGVDLNRNWDHRWEEDPSTRPESRNYKGPRPFSEPETRALRDLILRERPVLVVDLHSPGKITPGNVVFWPWLVKREDELGADAAAYRVIAQALAGKTETQQDGVFLREAPGYDVLPKEQNWVYRKTGACVLLVEIGERFWEEGPTVDAIAERTAIGLEALLERVRSGPGLLVVVRDPEGRPVDAEVIVEEAHDLAVGPRTTDPRTGVARRFLSSGKVTVVVRADGRGAERCRVEIVDRRWTRTEITLRPRR